MEKRNATATMTALGVRTDLVWYGFWLILLSATVLFEATLAPDQINLHVLQAQAFLRGDFAVEGLQLDVAVFEGRYYVPFPPFPAVVLLPLVAVFGTVDTSLVAAGLTLLNVWTITRICRYFDLEPAAISWILLAYLLGTPYFCVFKFSHGVWYFSHVVAFTFSLLAIRFALVEKNIWVASACLGGAILSRQLSIYIYPFILACYFHNLPFETRRLGIVVLKSVVVLAVFALSYFYFNWARFGNPYDTGYMYISLDPFLDERRSLHGLFHPAFIPFNFAYMFLQGPHIVFDGLLPFSMDPFGTSLTFAAPFLFLMALPPETRRLESFALACTALALVHMLMYFANGWAQVHGPRFAVDFIPMLLVISIQFLKRRGASGLFQGLVIYAVALNLFAQIGLPGVIRVLGRLMG